MLDLFGRRREGTVCFDNNILKEYIVATRASVSMFLLQKYYTSVNTKWQCILVPHIHSSYLSQPPQPAVVYFFLAGVLFSIENAKYWQNLANFDQFWLCCREFTKFFGVLFIDLNNAAVY